MPTSESTPGLILKKFLLNAVETCTGLTDQTLAVQLIQADAKIQVGANQEPL